MDLLGTVLLLVLIGSEAQNLVNVTGELGQDATLTCSFKRGDVYWFMEVHSRIRALIGESLSSLPTYFSTELEAKYSLSGNQLTVRNLSVEDDRMYFCGKKEDGRTVYGDPIRLIVSGQPTPGPPATSCTVSPAAPNSIQEWQKLPVVVASFSLNCIFLIVVLGFLCVYIRRNGFCCCRAKDSATYNVENNDMQNPQYEEIQLPPTPVPVLVPIQDSSECIYYKAQHPNPKMPRY